MAFEKIVLLVLPFCLFHIGLSAPPKSPPPFPPSPPNPPPSPPSPPPPPYQFDEYIYFSQALRDIQLNTTIKFLNQSHLDVAIANFINVTFFGPDEEAWSSFPTQKRGKQLEALLNGNNTDLVVFNLLLYHVVSQYKTSESLISTTSGSGLPTILGPPVYVTSAEGLVYLYANASNPLDNVTQVNNDANPSSSIISLQVINRILIPADLNILLTPRPGLVPFIPYSNPSPPPNRLSPPPNRLSPPNRLPPSPPASPPSSGSKLSFGMSIVFGAILATFMLLV